MLIGFCNHKLHQKQIPVKQHIQPKMLAYINSSMMRQQFIRVSSNTVISLGTGEKLTQHKVNTSE